MRRIIGYDRFEGRAAWEALSELYRVLRVYVNFFQPSLKLLSKERNGAKVSKKYHTAKTPHQRVIMVKTVSQGIKDALNEQYERLDPVVLLEELKTLQSKLFKYAGVAARLWKLQTLLPYLISLLRCRNRKGRPAISTIAAGV